MIGSESLTQSQNGDTGPLFSLLQISLDRQSSLELDRDSLAQQLKLLDEVVKRKDQQQQSDKMIIKFRDTTINLIKRKSSPESTSQEFVRGFNPFAAVIKKRLVIASSQTETH